MEKQRPPSSPFPATPTPGPEASRASRSALLSFSANARNLVPDAQVQVPPCAPCVTLGRLFIIVMPQFSQL